MNKRRRKDIDLALGDVTNLEIGSIRDAIQTIIDEETETLEMLPENLQESERADTMQEAIDFLEQALEEVENIESSITDCCDYLDQSKG